MSVNGKKIDNIDEKKLAELFKELRENIKKGQETLPDGTQKLVFSQ